jgi:hypothetical protein
MSLGALMSQMQVDAALWRKSGLWSGRREGLLRHAAFLGLRTGQARKGGRPRVLSGYSSGSVWSPR